MAEWQGNEAYFAQLCQIFTLAASPDNAVQQQVLQRLNELSQLPDFSLYLVTILAKMPQQPEVVRQRAGLLLKANLMPAVPPPTAEIAAYLQAVALVAVADSSRVIRHTAGTVITAVFQKVGMANCLQTLEKLTDYLGRGDVNLVEGSFSALNKVCEDGAVLLEQYREAPAAQQAFVVWCAERLLPRLLEYAQPSAAVVARRNAIECLNHFVLNDMIRDAAYPALHPFAARYIEVLGHLANDTDVEVLRHVCRGFVCVFDNEWECLNVQTCQVILQFMLKASRHPEYVVRLEALEVWTCCSRSPEVLAVVQPLLPELMPILLANMVYSEADYCGMEESHLACDNAAVPDQPEDIKPRFHKDDDEDEEEMAVTSEWTARRAAALALDDLANAFGHSILEVVLPLIEEKLNSPQWEVQESGVFAIGAVGMACMDSIAHFLPKIIELLIRLCRQQGQQPLLKSISCWCVSRFSRWICHEKNPDRQQVLRVVLETLLERMLDRNKRVQQAACSGFSTLAEEAREHLAPFLDGIVQTITQAFQLYQARNVLLLYDAIGTLAEAVGNRLDKPAYLQVIVAPLMQKFDALQEENDRALVPLFECLMALSQQLGVSLLPIIPRLVERCVQLIIQGAQRAKMWEENPNEFEKPDREVMATSIDLLSGIVEGVGPRIKEVLAQRNFLLILPDVLRVDAGAVQVRQCVFALVGDCAQHCMECVLPALPELLPLCTKALIDDTSAQVSNNASWAIGEICMKAGPEAMVPYLEQVLPPLVALLTRGNRGKKLMVNVSCTLGRLGMVCAPRMGKVLGQFAKPWCTTMKGGKADDEKISAFQGLCAMIKVNPEACLHCVPELAGAIGSFFPAPPQLEASFKDILYAYKQGKTNNGRQTDATWKLLASHLPEVSRRAEDKAQPHVWLDGLRQHA
eukprot:TRINITY_DN41958_c0_g1_i2.p1 TRINITY_DN41958_c0_g1~~TRINITY_DN41958_c0_g1_i2.p1  ORF type:complete len:918 (-),score=216.38 TRINITY_DN41958_c0_g1_i2:85-2838(-)